MITTPYSGSSIIEKKENKGNQMGHTQKILSNFPFTCFLILADIKGLSNREKTEKLCVNKDKFNWVLIKIVFFPLELTRQGDSKVRENARGGKQ